eukprot:gene8296-9854_t
MSLSIDMSSTKALIAPKFRVHESNNTRRSKPSLSSKFVTSISQHSSRKSAPKLKLCAQADNTAEAEEELAGGVSIRRRPPGGIGKHGVHSGDVGVNFYVEDIDNEPRNILEEIVWYKYTELEWRKDHVPLDLLKSMLSAAPPVKDFVGAIKAKYEQTGKPGLIAEVKKASPSKGVIQPDFNPVRIARAYEEGGAACLSVLTDEKFFQGSFEYLKDIKRGGVRCPLLCKEFIVEPYQIFMARSRGADAILLIAAVLPNQDLKYFMKIAHNLGMQCLIEVHTEAEMKRVLELEQIDLLGINNRDLGTFSVDLQITVDLLSGPLGDIVRERDILMVGESGIFTPEDVKVVQDAGTRAILVGESLVRENDPTAAIKTLLSLE